jgi:hypothetical protein
MENKLIIQKKPFAKNHYYVKPLKLIIINIIAKLRNSSFN